MNESLATNLIAAARRAPERPALRLDDTTITYAELNDATARVAGLMLERGLEPGDRVGVMLPNTPEFAIVYSGVLRAGGVVVPMNVLLKQREVAFYLRDSEAKLLFAWEGFADDAKAGAEKPQKFAGSYGRGSPLCGDAVPWAERSRRTADAAASWRSSDSVE